MVSEPSRTDSDNIIDHTILTVAAVAEVVITRASQWCGGPTNTAEPSQLAIASALEDSQLLTATEVQSEVQQSPAPIVIAKRGQCDCALYDSFPHRRRKCFMRNVGVITNPPLEAAAQFAKLHDKDGGYAPELANAKVMGPDDSVPRESRAPGSTWTNRRFIYSSDTDSDSSGSDIEGSKRTNEELKSDEISSKQGAGESSQATAASKGLRCSVAATAVLSFHQPGTAEATERVGIPFTEYPRSADCRFALTIQEPTDAGSDTDLYLSLLEGLDVASEVPYDDTVGETRNMAQTITRVDAPIPAVDDTNVGSSTGENEIQAGDDMSEITFESMSLSTVMS